MKNYKELPNEDKIAAVMEGRFMSDERAFAEQYLEALKANNYAVIEAFEALGDRPQQIVANKRHFDRAFAAFGFTDHKLTQYGWAEQEEFLDCETFSFGCGKKCNMGTNSLTIGRGPNGKWTYGLSLGTSNTGMGYWLSVFRTPHPSRHECLRHGLEKVIDWHTKEGDRKLPAVIKEAKDMLDTIMGRKSVQLSLL